MCMGKQKACSITLAELGNIPIMKCGKQRKGEGCTWGRLFGFIWATEGVLGHSHDSYDAGQLKGTSK